MGTYVFLNIPVRLWCHNLRSTAYIRIYVYFYIPIQYSYLSDFSGIYIFEPLISKSLFHGTSYNHTYELTYTHEPNSIELPNAIIISISSTKAKWIYLVHKSIILLYWYNFHPIIEFTNYILVHSLIHTCLTHPHLSNPGMKERQAEKRRPVSPA